MNHDETAEYIKRTLDGSPEAFSELYRMTYRRIYYICINFLKNRHDVDDAVQETYLSAYRKLDRLDEPSKFSSWLEKIAVNKCMDFLRKKVPVPDDSIEEMIEEEKTVVLPEQYITDSENRRIVIDIMRESLSDLQYQTVFMYYFNNFTVRETAEIMRCSEGAVKNRLSTARTKIKAGVEKYQDESGEKLHSVSLIPFLSEVFEKDFKHTYVPRIKGFASESLTKSAGKAGIFMLKGKIIAGAAASVLAVGGATAGLLSHDNIPEENRKATAEVYEIKTGVIPEESGTDGLFSETLSVLKTTELTTTTTTVTSTSSTTETTETTAATTSSGVSPETTTTAFTEVQTVSEQEVITEIPPETETVTEIYEEPSQPETESIEKYQNALDELKGYQDRFFEYVKIASDSTNGMIEMCRDKPIGEDFEGEEKEKFLAYSSLSDEYEQKICDLFEETEELVKCSENNRYYEYYVNVEKNLSDSNYGAPQGTYVGSVQQWYAINAGYDRLLEYLMSGLEAELPAEAFSLIQQSGTEWTEKHEYFLNNVIIHDGNEAYPSTGEFEARSRKYRCIMLMLYYCRTI